MDFVVDFFLNVTLIGFWELDFIDIDKYSIFHYFPVDKSYRVIVTHRYRKY